MIRAKKTAVLTMLAALGAVGLGGALPASAADGGMLPHPGPEGLVWVEEFRDDGGVASGGAWESLPTILTVACEGGGTVRVTMESNGVGTVAAFDVECPVGSAGVGSVRMDAGVVRPGSFTIGVDASAQTTRWSLTVTQPE
ncbi:hypothetical protein [Streptomyces sp. NBC_01443]|uniref:hypothetical protein n=1 Tax=Streptomyces sp. NBC_01443 TaxID=2903868 RepID=UPI002253CAEE|nr:hypothetical protein [Streptomyces sp. NBC_01443]MCX4625530.1 hypothetical protein [Streptomyces sp. NBC_01443]